MKNAVIAATLFAILVFGLVATAAYAQEEQQSILLPEEEQMGVSPDSPLYGLSVALDRIRLALVFDKEKKAELGLKIAEKHLQKAKILALKGKAKGLDKATANYERFLEIARKQVELAKARNETERAEKLQALITQLEIHEDEVEDAEELLAAANITDDQRERILQKLEQMKQRAEEHKKMVEARKEQIKTLLKQKYNMSEEEVDEVMEHLEEKVAEKNIKFRAKHEIAKANRTINFMENLLEKFASRANVSEERIAESKHLLEMAKELYNQAISAYQDKRYFRAWELAKESQRLARLSIARPSERALERILEKRVMNIIKGEACPSREAIQMVEEIAPANATCRIRGFVEESYVVVCKLPERPLTYLVEAEDCEVKSAKEVKEMIRERLRERMMEELERKIEMQEKLLERLEKYREISRERMKERRELLEKLRELREEEAKEIGKIMHNISKTNISEEVEEEEETEQEQMIETNTAQGISSVTK